MEINARAPAKVILFGEHYVVYGAPGIVAAIEPYNEVGFSWKKGARGRLGYESTQKESNADVFANEKTGKDNSGGRQAIFCSREIPTAHPIAAIYCHYVKRYPQICEMEIKARVKKAWGLKGVGNSASLAACFSLCAREALGLPSGIGGIFDDVQVGEAAAHGKPSGIDASAVCYGGVLEFRKKFAGVRLDGGRAGNKGAGNKFERPDVKKMDFEVGDGHSFLLIDTLKKDGARSSTKEMIGKFAAANGVGKAPAEMEKGERGKICEDYLDIYKAAARAIKNSDAHAIAQCMNENHALLKKFGVSSQSIELAVKTSVKAGAAGAKMTAAGGIGGAAVALCPDEKISGIKKELRRSGFGTYEFRVAERGVHKKGGAQK
ncbi:MAG: hypothetical protein V1822_03350 [Candidatus Micrarchaeota archaeon]